jgi:hypothetical protein
MLLKWHDASDLVWAYFKKKLLIQFKAVAFIVIYLFIFQIAILNLPINELPKIFLGISLVVFGLTFFMEGLVLGIMPIGESLGLKLPARLALPWILVFSLILGVGATFAEPAIGILRAMGESVVASDAPLLHHMLSRKPHELILCVGVGVGIAVIFGVLRFLYNWSLKPLIYSLVTICIGLSAYGLFDAQFAQIIGLAWDCGAVTTGPVTVPLVIALGLGISRVVTGHTDEGTSSGFGVVTLASLFPIIAVLLLGLYYSFTVNFTSPVDAQSVTKATSLIQEVVVASDSIFGDNVKESFLIASQAILPLCLFMILVFRGILRQKFVFLDEIILGITLSLVGMTLFNLGIELGLGKLGKQVGNVLPAAYSSVLLPNESKVIHNFDLKTVQERYNDEGGSEKFFYLTKNKEMTTVVFEESHFDPSNKTYTFTPKYGPIWGQDHFSLVGILVVLLFAFMMGYGATLAEPALNTLGATVEDLSVGTFKKTLLIQAVAIGVGLGITLGLTKIIWEIPLFWLLAPPYVLLLILSYFSSEEFVNIAWDSAGVTTGPVTVPLVLAMGLGVGAQSGAMEGFGILAMASVCPIMSVLVMGLVVKRNRQKMLIEANP